MNIWDKLLEVDVKNKEKFVKIFSDVVKMIGEGIFDFKEKKEDNYSIVIEENRVGSYFVHIVPDEVLELFKEMKKIEGFLGFSVLAGKYKNKDVRVSCFGIECNKLGKGLF